jgi:2-dehydro-3-deoxyglucarate aldolase
MIDIKKINDLREKIERRNLSIGSWIQLQDPNSAEIMAHAGFDWIAIDMEHGCISNHELPNLCRALELGDTVPLVRIFSANERDVRTALEAGAAGLIVPRVESAAQIKQVLSWSQWPPKGQRGVGFSRANLYGDQFTNYKEFAQSPIIIPMIESQEGVTNLHDILNTDGINTIFVGPYDLSASLGITGKLDNPIYAETLDKIKKTCRSMNKGYGIHVVSPEKDALRDAINEGYTFIAFSIDATFLRHSSKNPLKEETSDITEQNRKKSDRKKS